MRNFNIQRALGLLLMVSGLIACGEAGGPGQHSLANIPPLEGRLNEIWVASCGNCHTSRMSGAPRLGDTEAWAPVIAQGMDTMLEHTINGYRKMPPLGLCSVCTEEDFVALISWMSGMDRTGQAPQ